MFELEETKFLFYRAEIDGLRALAVVPVILFHAGLGPFSGGYVGVDVFFVISGFLITSIILKDLEMEKFSLIEFYERRIRRIIPALFFVVLVSIPFAWHFLTPKDMREFAQSVMSVATFLSNIFFWKESGYFDTAAEFKPLLHTWSLAVEEQYYILFPILLIFLWRFGRKVATSALIVVFIASVSLAQWGAYNQPTASFFLLPTRGWEILMGAFCAFYLSKQSVPFSRWLNQSLSLTGLLLIFIAVFTFDETTPTPGLPMLLPTIGAALIILFATQGTLAKALLGSAPFVGIGLISYSLYLWHQPVFAFARHSSHSAYLSSYGYPVLILISFILAWVSWRYVETPFRRRDMVSKTQLLTLTSSMFGILVLFGATGSSSSGFKALMYQYKYDEITTQRIQFILEATDYDFYDHMVDNGRCAMWIRDTDSISESRIAKCKAEFGGALVILGDSHAMNLYNIIAKSGVHPFVIGVSQGGCRPHNNRPECHYESFETYLTEHPANIGGIIFHQSGFSFVKGSRENNESHAAFEGDLSGFETTNIEKSIRYLQAIESRSEVNVLWIGPFLEYGFDPVENYAIKKQENINPITVRIFQNLEEVILKINEKKNFENYQTFGNFFNIPTKPYLNDCFIFKDADHFSKCGEDILSKSPKLRAFDWNEFTTRQVIIK